MLKQMNNFLPNMKRDKTRAIYEEIGTTHDKYWIHRGNNYYCFEHDEQLQLRMRRYCQSHDYYNAFKMACEEFVITWDLMQLIVHARSHYDDMRKRKLDKKGIIIRKKLRLDEFELGQ